MTVTNGLPRTNGVVNFGGGVDGLRFFPLLLVVLLVVVVVVVVGWWLSCLRIAVNSKFMPIKSHPITPTSKLSTIE